MTSESGGGPDSYKLSNRMAVIAFISVNVSLACMWGSFPVLLAALEARMGVGREIGTLGAMLASLSTSLTAPFVGNLAGRMSIRLLMLVGAAIGAAGFLVLALSSSMALDLAAYALLIGPGMCLTAIVLPQVLVTRWFNARRGRAIGFVMMPVLLPFTYPFMNWLLHAQGLTACYLTLAAVTALTILPILFIVDYPPDSLVKNGQSRAERAALQAGAPGGGLTAGMVLRSAPFWGFAAAFAISACGAIILGSQLVVMAMGWGIVMSKAAGLSSINALMGIPGNFVAGWLADKVGGGRAQVILSVDLALLWLVLLLHPNYFVVAVAVGLAGAHAAGMVPAVATAMSERFGKAGFSQAYGLANLVSLPMVMGGIPFAAAVFERTGGYTIAIIAQMGLFVIGALASFAAVRAPLPPARQAVAAV